MTNHFRGIILHSMARTLWVTAYADEVEERAHSADAEHEHISPEERQVAYDIVRNMIGRDWMDEAPETPEAAAGMAAELCRQVESLNSRSIEDGFVVALVADLLHERRKPNNINLPAEGPDDAADQLADTFGHYLAMEAMGHGVGWEDDHAEMPFKLPHGFENYELRDEVKL